MARQTKATAGVLNQLQELPDNYLQCREMRAHAWAVSDDFHLVHHDELDTRRRLKTAGRGSIVRRSLICMRCDTHADDYYTIRRLAGLETLVRIGNRVYTYADGYQIKGTSPSGFRMTDLAKHEAYRRAMSKAQLEGVTHDEASDG